MFYPGHWHLKVICMMLLLVTALPPSSLVPMQDFSCCTSPRKYTQFHLLTFPHRYSQKFYSLCVSTSVLHSLDNLLLLCEANTYLWPLTNWTKTCTLVFLSPNINVAPNNQFLLISLTTNICHERTVTLIPFLASLKNHCHGGTGIGGLAPSLTYYLIQDSLEEISQDLFKIKNKLIPW